MDIPSPIPTGQLGPFRFWCQRVLPAVYDDELSYYEVLCIVRDKLNDVINILNQQGENVNGLIELYNELNERVTALETEVDDIKNGTWSFLSFDTVATYDDPDYGKLIIKW